MAQSTVLIVEDELAIRDMLRLTLELADYHCLDADNIQDAYALVVDERPDIVLLDWMLPGGSGLELLRRLRRNDTTSDMPVIMLTARTAEENVVQGLEVGADDYMSKPFSPRELLARVKALLRRSPAGRASNQLLCQELQLDVDSHQVTLGEEVLSMGPTEFRLLRFFMSHPGRVYSRAQLLDLVWGANVHIDERSVDVHIRRLRLALKTKLLDYRNVVQTVRGAGYLFSGNGI